MPPHVDVAVVGGGLSGCIAAKLVADLGYEVVVLDRHADPPPEFRAEQLVGAQIDRLRALGVLDAMIGDAVASTVTVNLWHGAVVDRTRVQQYGLPYRAMVRGARAALPSGRLRCGRVVAIEPTADGRQTVRLADGDAFTARLVVVATGLLPQVQDALGIGMAMVSAAHSLCLGFDLSLDAAARGRVPLTSYGERAADKIDYLVVFEIGAACRVNLFAYQDRASAWTNGFVDQPEARLRELMPGLARCLGDFQVASPVQARSSDIEVATNPVRDGVVLVGDAFQTPCPAAGTGIDRLLSDVDALSRWLPAAMARPSIDAAAVSRFYDDPAKRAFDAECIRIARYRRALATDTSARWRLHRQRVLLQRRLRRLYGPAPLPTVYGRLGRA